MKSVHWDRPVLTDLRMPLASGRTILSAVTTYHPDVPVLVMSAFWTDEMKDECEALGATKFMCKPMNAPHLLSSIVLALQSVN